MEELIYREESYAIMGACFSVYKDKGCGFLESVYQECLQIEFETQKIPFVAQKTLDLYYRGRKLESVYKPDFICFEKVIVEIKAVQNISEEHKAQVINYLKATGYKLGLLINFGHFPQIQSERIAWTKTVRR